MLFWLFSPFFLLAFYNILRNFRVKLLFFEVKYSNFIVILRKFQLSKS
jgi:hypothetical protein